MSRLLRICLNSLGHSSSMLLSRISRHAKNRGSVRSFSCYRSTSFSTDLLCAVDAEPLYRYKPGGYHPVHLGDVLKEKRYRILQKLGWGGYSTVWAAKDERKQQLVAIKISVADNDQENREHEIMDRLDMKVSGPAGFQHLMRTFDYFQVNGPNGSHDCHVFELLGPSVSNAREYLYDGQRLPGALAKRIIRQVATGLICLHEQGVVHGDMHVGNLAFAIPALGTLTESKLLHMLGRPEIKPVTRASGKPVGIHAPRYLVAPASFSADSSYSSADIRICDFGGSFLTSDPPVALHTPLTLRPPEVIFGDVLSCKVDLWAFGCMMFELVVGQPPFDTIMITPRILVQEMLESTCEELPERWQERWHAMGGPLTTEEGPLGPPLQKWLEETYFDGERRQDMSYHDILALGQSIQKLLRLEPSSRPTVQAILDDQWFNED